MTTPSYPGGSEYPGEPNRGYPQQSQSSYQPGYSYHQQPASPGPLPPMPYRTADLTVGNAVSWSWRTLWANPAGLIPGFLVWGLLTGVVQFQASRQLDDLEVFATPIGVSLNVFTLVANLFFAIVFAHVTLLAAAGKKVAFTDFFSFPNLAALLGAGLLGVLGTVVGFALCIIPGFVLAFLWFFTCFVGVDQNLGAIDSLKGSWNFAAQNAGALLPVAIVATLIDIAGTITVVGWVITGPVTALMAAYSYVTLTGRVVAE